MRDKILRFVRENGPVLPVEVSSKMETNSFLANAFLEELVEANEIIASKEKVGAVRLFYTKEQETQANERIKKLAPKIQTASTYAKKPLKVTSELEKKREEFASRLKNIEKTEGKTNRKAMVSLPTGSRVKLEVPEAPNNTQTKSVLETKPQRVEIIPKIPPFRAARSFIKNKMNRKLTRKVQYNPPNENVPQKGETFEESALIYLREKNIKLLSEPQEVGTKETQVKVNVPSGVGPVKFLVKIKNKKKVNKSDLMQYYAEALEKRMPIILLLKGELAITAKTYLKDAGGFLRVKIFK